MPRTVTRRILLAAAASSIAALLVLGIAASLLALIRRMLANSTRRGDLVLDPFASSGSTIVAAEQMERRVAAIELEPGFCDVIVRRWRDLRTDQPVRRVRDGQVVSDG